MARQTQFEQGREMAEQLQAMIQIPGAIEMLITEAAKEYEGRGNKPKRLRLYQIGGPVKGYAQGGLGQIMAQQSPEVREEMSTGEDEIMLSVSPDEYDALTAMWGEPEIGPDGIPSYGFLSKLWKGVKKTVKKIVKSPLFSFVAPIALNIFAPGIGTALTGALGKVGADVAIRAGIGALSGGKRGAIAGALSGLTAGGVGANIGQKLGLKGMTAKVAGDAILGGVGAEAAGGDFASGALGQAASSIMQHPTRRMQEKVEAMGRDFFKRPAEGEFDLTPETTAEVAELTGQPELAEVPLGDVPAELAEQLAQGPIVADQPGFFERGIDWMKEHPYLTAGGALGLAAMMGGAGRGEEPGEIPQLPPRFQEGLPNLTFDRQQMPVENYMQYGLAGGPQEAEAMFFNPNVIPAPGVGDVSEWAATQGQALPGLGGPVPTGAIPGGRGFGGNIRRGVLEAQGWTYDPATNMMIPPAGYNTAPVPAAFGGLIQKYQAGGHVRGPGTGRSDEIPAVLSDGEYVIDSESVALLGDGSTDAGAKRLDEMRENLRRHKGRKLADGKFSHKAKTPEKYMQEGGYVPPKENPYKKGTARYKMWERKYGKKKTESKKPTKDNGDMTDKARRYLGRTKRELERLGEGMKEGGKVKSTSAMKDLKSLSNKLEKAITTGNERRMREITSRLDSLSSDLKFSRGGYVKQFKRRARAEG